MATLTSWKEIAAYLGKGVRTAQRWELTGGLPIRRPSEHPLNFVLAYSHELDEWLHSTYVNRDTESKNDVAKLLLLVHALQNELENLRAENGLLRQQLQFTSQAALQPTSDDYSKGKPREKVGASKKVPTGPTGASTLSRQSP
jgi:hypothetical protein